MRACCQAVSIGPISSQRASKISEGQGCRVVMLYAYGWRAVAFQDYRIRRFLDGSTSDGIWGLSRSETGT